jgi:hypothetical protein
LNERAALAVLKHAVIFIRVLVNVIELDDVRVIELQVQIGFP